VGSSGRGVAGDGDDSLPSQIALHALSGVGKMDAMRANMVGRHYQRRKVSSHACRRRWVCVIGGE
jgi:hypothetical protein